MIIFEVIKKVIVVIFEVIMKVTMVIFEVIRRSYCGNFWNY